MNKILILVRETIHFGLKRKRLKDSREGHLVKESRPRKQAKILNLGSAFIYLDSSKESYTTKVVLDD